MREQSNAAQRFDDLKCFYAALDALARKTNGARLLSTCDGRMGWPERGVYFFRNAARTERIPAQGRGWSGSEPTRSKMARRCRDADR